MNDSKAEVEWGGLPSDDPRNETNAFTLERAAIQLFRAQQLLAEDYDGWWSDAETNANWQQMLIEAERDRYRTVALDFMLRAGLRGIQLGVPE